MEKVLIEVRNQDELDKVNKILNTDFDFSYWKNCRWFIHNINDYWTYNSSDWIYFPDHKHLIVSTEDYIKSKEMKTENIIEIGKLVPKCINLFNGNVQGYDLNGNKNQGTFSEYLISNNYSKVGKIRGEYFQLECDINTNLWFKISDFQDKKETKIEDIIGCTIETLKGNTYEILKGERGLYALKGSEVFESPSYIIEKWDKNISDGTWTVIKQSKKEIMKKYRVIKSLPDVAEGTIGTKQINGLYLFAGIKGRGHKNRQYDEAAIIASPEYFEEVIDYGVGDIVVWTRDDQSEIREIWPNTNFTSGTKKCTLNAVLDNLKYYRKATESEIAEYNRYIPKVGDYFTVANLFGKDNHHILGKTFQVEKIEPKGFEGNDEERVIFDGPGRGLYFKCIRAATSEEITKYKEENNIPKIGGYSPEFANGYVEFGCQSYNLENLRAFRMLVSSPVNATIDIKGTKITLEILDKIIKRIS